MRWRCSTRAAMCVSSARIAGVVMTFASTSSYPGFEEGDQRRVGLVRRLHVRHVAKAGEQEQSAVAIGNGVGDELHPLLEHRGRSRQVILGAAEQQRWRLD